MATFVDPAIPELLYSDPSRIKQIVYNLMSNAIKFTESGHLFLRLRKQVCNERDCLIRVDVIDSGIGMNKEQKDRLFQSFSQADRSTSRKYGGTGLGLAISKKLVEAMGGNIGVDSAPGFGSSFWFTLPFGVDANAVSADEAGQTRQHWYFVSDYVPLLEFIETSLNKARFAMHSIIVQEGEIEWPTSDIVGRNVLAFIKGDNPWPRKLYWGTLDAIRSVLESELTASASGGGDGQANRPGITMESVPFCLDQIFSRRKSAKRTAMVVPAQSRGSNLQHLHVLVAEDNPVNQMVIRGLLRPLVGEVEVVNNGLEALEKVTSSRVPYDVVFMDCEMPEMDGYEATRRIRDFERRNQISRPTVVVALTAHAFEEFRDKAFECGMNQHLSKPVTRDMLYQFLASHYGHLLELDQRSPRFNNDNIA